MLYVCTSCVVKPSYCYSYSVCTFALVSPSVTSQVFASALREHKTQVVDDATTPTGIIAIFAVPST